MNEYEVTDALVRYADHDVLGPATRTLSELVEWTNSNSDGWPYWPEPSRAARKLQELIGSTRTWLDDPDRTDVTVAALKRAYVPLKAFRTRQGADFPLYLRR